jgi:hypothetical protein
MGEVKETYKIYRPIALDPLEAIDDLIRQLNEQFERISEEVAPEKAYNFSNIAKPSVRSGNLWQTGGTTKIINLLDGVPWQRIRLFARHTVTLEHNANIQLEGNEDFNMVDGDHILLIQKADGVWYELSRGTAAADSEAIGVGNPLEIGDDDTEVGIIKVYGGGAGDDGGEFYLYLGADDDGTIDRYNLKVVEDDLQIGPDTDPDAIKFNGGSSLLDITASGGLTISGGDVLATHGDLRVGVNDTTRGIVSVYGPATGSDGGTLRLYQSGDYDSNYNWAEFRTFQGNILIGPNNRTDALTYDYSANKWVVDGGNLQIGIFSPAIDATQGSITIYGQSTGGGGNGGVLDVYPAQDHDTTINYYRISPDEDDLLIGPSTDTDALKYDGGNTRFEFTSGSGPVLFSAGARVKHATDDVSNPPTDAELDTAFGTPAAVGAGFVGTLDDNAGGANFYIVSSDGTNWWYTAMTKAT